MSAPNPNEAEQLSTQVFMITLASVAAFATAVIVYVLA